MTKKIWNYPNKQEKSKKWLSYFNSKPLYLIGVMFCMGLFLLSFVNAVTPTLSISYPTGIIDYGKLGENLTLNFTATSGDLDNCWYNYNGTNTSLNTLINNNEAPNFGTYSTAGATVYWGGSRFDSDDNYFSYIVAKDSTNTATRARILWANSTVISTVSFVGLYATFTNVTTLIGNDYRLEIGIDGATGYNLRYNDSYTYPNSTGFINWKASSQNGVDYGAQPTRFMNIINVTATRGNTLCVSGNPTVVNFTLTNQKNLTLYANDTSGNLASEVINWDYKVFENSQTYSTNVYETGASNFQINLTIKDGFAITTPLINYDGINYTSNSNGVAGYYTSQSFEIPILIGAETEKTFYWIINYQSLTNSSNSGLILTESVNQTVSLINLSFCSSATNMTLNFTAQNEENLTALNNWNFLGTFEYWIGSGNVRKNVSLNKLNVNSSALCINPAGNLTYYSDAIIQYEKTDYVKRNYYLYNASLTNSTQNITLYLLESSAATAFIISVKDGSQLPITDAYIYIQRNYPGTGAFQTVAMAKTDGNGNTVGHFETETEDYRIIVMKDGIIIYTSPIQKVYCSATPCTLPIQTESAGVSGWAKIGNLSNLLYYGPTYNSSNGLISYTYVDTSGTTHYGKLLVYTINSGTGKEYICNISSTSNAATLTCNVSNITGTVYAEGYISRSPEVLVWGVSFIINSVKAIMGFEGLFWAMIVIIILAIAGVLIGGVSGGIIGTIIGFVGTGWLGIASFGTVTIWGLIIIGVFIIWQIKN